MELNNQFYPYVCPGLMEDGRFTRNFLNNTIFNQKIRHINGIENNHQYRYFLQKNGSKIIENERNFYLNNYICKFSSDTCKNPKQIYHVKSSEN
jgi:hypothetical protein